MHLLFSLYLNIGLFATIAYRWSHPNVADGQDIALDALLWPMLVYYWARYGKGL